MHNYLCVVCFTLTCFWTEIRCLIMSIPISHLWLSMYKSPFLCITRERAKHPIFKAWRIRLSWPLNKSLTFSKRHKSKMDSSSDPYWEEKKYDPKLRPILGRQEIWSHVANSKFITLMSDCEKHHHKYEVVLKMKNRLLNPHWIWMVFVLFWKLHVSKIKK